MNELLLNWLMFVSVLMVAMMAPGPDFVMAARNSVLHSRMAGIFTAFGFAAGIVIHMTYTVIGLAAIIAQSVFWFSVIKYTGAAYLLYVGYKAFRSNGFVPPEKGEGCACAPLSLWHAFRDGFLTNALNPKVTLFFLAVFTQFMTPETPFWVQAGYGATCVVMTALWFSLVATVLTTPAVKAVFLKAAQWIDRICGGLFVALGLKLAFARFAP